MATLELFYRDGDNYKCFWDVDVPDEIVRRLPAPEFDDLHNIADLGLSELDIPLISKYGYDETADHPYVTICEIHYDDDPNSPDSQDPLALHVAAAAGDLHKLQALLAAGAKVDATNVNGETPLMWAAAAGQAETIQALLAANARAGRRDARGNTALHHAAHYGRSDASRALMAAWECSCENRDGESALHVAARGGWVEMVRVLLECGADVDRMARYLMTPLHVASQLGHAGVVEALLAAGANVNWRSKRGQTPLDLCRTTREDLRFAAGPAGRHCDSPPIRQLLRAAGGKTGEELDAGDPPEPVRPPAVAARTGCFDGELF